MKKVYLLILCFVFYNVLVSAQTPIDYSVRVSANLQESPAQIQLHWPKDPNAANYYVYRKHKSDPLFSGTPVATLTSSDTSFTDKNISVGDYWEYQIIKTISGNTYYGYGYISTGIKVPVGPNAEYRGKLILIYDNAILPGLQPEFDRLILDMTKDGWTVLAHGVNTTDKVTDVHAIIKAEYTIDNQNVKAVFLLGHVPVPYSGGDPNFGYNPIDGHKPQHEGAWPADVYYADMTGTWTDAAVTDTVGEYAAQHNVPGDGKFDQDYLPGKATLQLGRVDMHDMPAFAPLTEIQLLKRYLDKDHQWRIGQVHVNNRGLVKDYFGTVSGEAFAACGYKNFAPMFGAWNVIDTGKWENNLSTTSYLWSYGTGPGDFVSAGGISSTTNFAKDSLRTVFTMLFGSWFGDWNSTNNYLRAPLASKGPILTDCWSGRPQWQFHHMAMGENIGYSTLLNFNEYGTFSDPTNYFRSSLISDYRLRMIHVALMGDPSLRMHMIIPPGKLTLSNNKLVVTVNWTASSDSGIAGYYVYRSSGLNQPFTRISPNIVTGTTFTDNNALHHKNFYMVRAVKLQVSASGSYYNLSAGSMDTLTTDNSGITSLSYINFVNVFPNPGHNLYQIAWTGSEENSGVLRIYDVLGKEVVGKNLSGLDHNQIIDIDLSASEKGVYILQISSGGHVYMQRIVKE
jgi:hypothetical protein